MYNRAEAEKFLTEKYGFQSTGEKHFESFFTKWHISFYLFEKFGIDKRKAHLSSLIVSGQITREEALEELKKSPVYPELGLEQKVMRYKIRPHTDFKTDKWYPRIASFINLWKF